MTVVFDKSIVSGTFPCEWKISKVTPVYKTGPREDMNNCRPISVISILLQKQCRLKLFYSQLYEYFIKNDMLTNSQRGFRPNIFMILIFLMLRRHSKLHKLHLYRISIGNHTGRSAIND
jgi:hypothetical protein